LPFIPRFTGRALRQWRDQNGKTNLSQLLDGTQRMFQMDETGETFDRTFKTIAKHKPKGPK
jgi:hypothetical protein